MIEGMRKAMHVDALWWLEELRQPRRYISALSGKGKDLTIDVQIRIPGSNTKIATTVLVDSGCTSSTINRALCQKAQYPDSCHCSPHSSLQCRWNSQSRRINYMLRRNPPHSQDHTEQIDLAVTELGDRQIFLGMTGWPDTTQSLMEVGGIDICPRCQCRKMLFVLPNADPDDKWDDELEEGETILMIDFTQAILIRAHHVNDLAAKASEGKEAKTFEEMVPEKCRDFTDLFEKTISMSSLSQRHGTMLLNSSPTQTPTSTAMSTLSIVTNKQNSTNSWTRTSQVEGSDHRSRLWLRRSSSSKRRMVSYDPYKIIASSTR